MLIDIRNHLQARGSCSLADLALHFNTTPDAMRGMLSHWLRKGRVVQEGAGCSSGCGGCTSCDPATLEFYRWQDRSGIIVVA